MTHFTCPHCGQRTSTDATNVEWVDVNGQDALFLSIPPGEERHIDQRLCCPECYERADGRHRDAQGVKQGPHPYGGRFHREVRLANPNGERR